LRSSSADAGKSSLRRARRRSRSAERGAVGGRAAAEALVRACRPCRRRRAPRRRGR
jgi:hypothetical protein